MQDRRAQVADAALELVAEHGLKGLTHRAVDQRAGVPLGTTSNYHRTRDALVDAVIARLEQRDLAVWDADRDMPPPADADELADLLTRYLGVFAGPQAWLTRARFAVSIAEPEAIAAGHRRFMALAEQMLAHAEIADPAERARWLADYCDGMLFHQVTARRNEPLDLAPHRRAIRALLA
ncbi:TetR/AcrR family transcriptional regulator [Agromyces aerolatus]|uniref:TetR/AcrR family transcriptional regulator n=1 Tax=Agromyces sp. LY-1074 TaxID=3074080 RepID=UPI002866E69D|nr:MULTISPECIES: TetR/AcrR family transcriptional regulator [unclassified Agromyces]MDR5698323.1 TetR/AcrR family transcriptional regulator [Agromyces sp. LY-1074]MDR5704617.1 TetR/AcrR family transcriptional regulator [Agromyces sp. LY-1358]